MERKTRLMQGNEAVAEGAIAAGVTFFAGYPITPSTEIAEQMAKLLPKIGGTFLQMEDEIGAMGAILGASLAGAKVMDATSGPGFSLKQELIGYAACAESFDMAVMAVNYAERFRTPVILLTDEIVGHLRENVTLPAPEEIEIYPRRRPKKTRAEGYQPYAVGEDLVPDVARFGDGYHIHVTGLLHDETGFPSGSPAVTEQLIRRLHEKISRVGEEIIHTEEAFMEDAEYAVVSYGGTARTAYEAVREARADGIRVGFLRLQTIWPFADAAVARLAARVKGILVAELNYGQLVGEVTRAAHGTHVRPCLKYNMLDFTPQEITAAIRQMSEEVRA